MATTMLNVDLSTCASPGDPGGVPLPGGEYSVYLKYDQVTGDRAVAGQWPLTLLTAPPAPTDLPAGFPVDEVPVIRGRLVSAQPLSTSGGDGWTLELAVDGDDAATEAIRLLGGDLPKAPSLSTSPDGYYPAGAWEVRIAPSVSADGEPSVVYTIRPS